jgi:N-acetylglucosamine-6-sulfatase
LIAASVAIGYAIDFIKQQPKDKPYFVMLSHKAVHEPFMPAPRHKQAYGADAKLAEPPSYAEDFADKPAWQRRQATREVRWHYRTREIEEEKLPAAVPPEPWKDHNKYVDQLRCLAAVDEGIGRIIELLRERGTLDNTIIVFTSDNGYFHMEHRRWDKRLAYEESLRIPLLVVYPGHIKPGSTVSQLVTNADFAPTILSYAGLAVPPQMQGASMKPLFEEPNPRWRNAVFYEYWKELAHSIPAMTALRTDRYKLITYPEIKDLDELFDLQKDPHEMNNLAVDPAHADLHASMKAQLEEARIYSGWSANAFPKNFPRINGQEGIQLDLVAQDGALVDRANSGVPFTPDNLQVREDGAYFDGTAAAVRVPFQQAIDPAG